MKATKTDVAM